MRRTKEEAEKTRQNLLAAALTVFSRKGYDGARLDDIAAEAGVTRGAIYHHFNNKAQLFIALIDEASGRGNQAIEKAIAQGQSIPEITRLILINTMELLEDDRRFREVTALSLSIQVTSPELEALTERRYQEAQALVENISGFFSSGIVQGDLDPDLDALTAARAMLAYQNGLAILWLANPDAFSIKADAPALADLFLRAITPVSGRLNTEIQ